MHLTDADRIASTHRGHGHCIAKGCDVERHDARDLRPQGRPLRRQGRLDAHRRPRRRACSAPTASSAAARRSPCGAALAAKTLKTGGVGVASSATAAPTRARRSRAMNMAGRGTCRRSSWSRTTATPNTPAPRTASVGGTSPAAPRGFGMPAARCDGADFFAVYEAAGEADRARARAARPSAAPRRRSTASSGTSKATRRPIAARRGASACARPRIRLKIFRAARGRGERCSSPRELDAIDARGESRRSTQVTVTEAQGSADADREGPADRRLRQSY